MAVRMKVDPGRALAWRLGRQYLVEGAVSAEDVVRRLGATVTWSGDPELAVGRRLRAAEPGMVARALEEGRLIRTWSFRGAVHLMEPSTAMNYLVLRCAGRQWELPSWVSRYRLDAAEWPGLRRAVREVLEDGPLTPRELGTEVAKLPRFRHLGDHFDAKNTTFLKPFAWQGDFVIGPGGEGELTLQSAPAPHAERPSLDEAGHAAIMDYFGAYGPASSANLQYWLGEGLSAGRRRIAGWLEDQSDQLVELDVGGEQRWHLADQLADLEAVAPTDGVHLLPGYDQWVMGPGTADRAIVGAAGRRDAGRGAPLVVVNGRASGTWKATRDELRVTWFQGGSGAPAAGLAAEIRRLSALLGRGLAVGEP